MKYLLILTLALSMCVSNAMEKTSGSNAQEKYTRVLGTGKTEEEAKLNGFKIAIQIVVGSVVVTEKEAKNNFLARDEVANYSAGYIDDYKIIDSTVTSSGYTLIMDVLVKNSKIAEQILNVSKGNAGLEGDRLSNQYKSYLNERQSGDNFVNTVLGNYPKNAFNVKVDKVEFKLDAYRNSILIIPYQVRMNYKWLESFRESLKVVEDGDSHSPGSIKVTVKKPDDWFGNTSTYNFNDLNRMNGVINIINDPLNILVKIVDYSGNTLYSRCMQAPKFVRYNESLTSGNDATVRGQDVFDQYAQLTIGPDSPMFNKLNSMNKIEVEVIRLPRSNDPICNTN